MYFLFDALKRKFDEVLTADVANAELQMRLTVGFPAEHPLVQEALVGAVMLRGWNDTAYPSYHILHSFFSSSQSLRLRLKVSITMLLLVKHRGDDICDVENRYFPGLCQFLAEYTVNIQEAFFATCATDKATRYKEKLMKEIHELSNQESFDEILKSKSGMMDELVQNGFDVNVDMFAHLISHPFFSELYNWFIPYTPEHPMLAGLRRELPPMLKIVQDTLIHNDVNCELDKYATDLFFGSMHKSHRIHVNALNLPVQDPENSEEMIKILSDIIRIKDRNVDARVLIYSMVRETYRFFTMSPWTDRYNSPFVDGFYLTDIIGELPVAFYTQCSRMAFKVAQFPRFTAGLDTMQRLSLVDSLLSETPDDANILVEKGTLLMENNQWQDALSIFSMLEYKGLKVKTSTRAIVRCSQELGDVERAERYLSKLSHLT